jgi:hypothetical protein
MSDAATRALDDAFLDIVADWRAGGVGCTDERFDAHALAIFSYQCERNEPYRRFAESLGFGPSRTPASWRDIPAVPSSAFKEATLATFDIARAELVFATSGTTGQRSGKHYVEHARLYDAALLAGFDRFMLPDRPKLRYLNLVPNPSSRPHSSLGYMMGEVSVLRGDGKAGYFLGDDDVDVDAFARALQAAVGENTPVCIAATAFAFAALLEALDTRMQTFAVPAGSRIMETGGFKGRARVVERSELYGRLSRSLGVPESSIVAEYGMTELLSQYYDSVASRHTATRVKVAPPWLRALVVDANGREVPAGEIGYLRHVDLANRSSVVAIETEDRGYRADDGIVLLGRDADAPLRGCSLDAEDLVARGT